MAIKNITYQRVLNLGNYESKRLELSEEVFEGDDAEESISRVMEMVERKIREDTSTKIEDGIRQLRVELRELKKEYETVKSSLETLTTTEEPNPDDIPFNNQPENVTEDF
ncbi:hypothetical protein NIES4072_29870 [Nostoc commune NIES-4072]|uniref:Uncharacterized protein n=1 Tax=Nostoc commune NIES-4072 TaxID=2005467 RepID=A0A2R5FKL3_NOSCO|nr:hypothetical protein [Nostoc commune]BBD69678.1 hypothetical protein NIES4070_60880 [Nostoc commune HK-02]GBG19320.1 hypothetical protein NIES4072_29870 [Nostoc commune NIES-4072]